MPALAPLLNPEAVLVAVLTGPEAAAEAIVDAEVVEVGIDVGLLEGKTNDKDPLELALELTTGFKSSGAGAWKVWWFGESQSRNPYP